jgi:N-acetylglucosaminyl-diphospho-decaprenol L-rhamnosyltransferase
VQSRLADITAVVVSYNSAEHLGQCVTALLDADVAEVRVVDNVSVDDSVAIARAAGAAVTCLPDNVGYGRAVNRGLAVADTSFVLIANPDCTVDAGALERLVAALDADPSLGAVAPRMQYGDGAFGIAGAADPSALKEWVAYLRVDDVVPTGVKQRLADARLPGPLGRLTSFAAPAVPDGVQQVDWICAWCALVRTEAFRLVGGFDDDFFLYFEDVDLCRRLRANGFGVAIAGDAMASHDESSSTLRVGKSRLYADGMRCYFDKHGSLGERVAIRALAHLMT